MRVTRPFLIEWPDVDIELRSAFSFDGVAALQAREIDVLVTPDPVNLPDLQFQPVFDYELRLVVGQNHPLVGKDHIEPADLLGEDLLTVPVTVERLDIYTRFLIPAACRPKNRIAVENIELMLQFVVAGRGVAVLPDWLVREVASGVPVATSRIGGAGLHKSINIGLRRSDFGTDYLAGFLDIARRVTA
jgi:LysR family transcriptional regulator for metE and metH